MRSRSSANSVIADAGMVANDTEKVIGEMPRESHPVRIARSRPSQREKDTPAIRPFEALAFRWAHLRVRAARTFVEYSAPAQL